MGTHPVFESDFDCLTENMGSWYFVRTPFPWVCAISFGMGLLFLLEYRPETVNHESLWFLGKLTKVLAEDYPTVITCIWYPAALCHLIEASYAFKVAQAKKLSTTCSACWFAQTLCFGYASLYYLNKYEPKES